MKADDRTGAGGTRGGDCHPEGDKRGNNQGVKRRRWQRSTQTHSHKLEVKQKFQCTFGKSWMDKSRMWRKPSPLKPRGRQKASKEGPGDFQLGKRGREVSQLRLCSRILRLFYGRQRRRLNRARARARARGLRPGGGRRPGPAGGSGGASG